MLEIAYSQTGYPRNVLVINVPFLEPRLDHVLYMVCSGVISHRNRSNMNPLIKYACKPFPLYN